MLTSPESAVSSIFIPPWPWPLTFWPQIVKHSSLSHNALLLYVWYYVSNTLQDIVLTIFRDAHTEWRTLARTDEQTKPLCLRPHYVGQRHKKPQSSDTPVSLKAALGYYFRGWRMSNCLVGSVWSDQRSIHMSGGSCALCYSCHDFLVPIFWEFSGDVWLTGPCCGL